MIGTVARAASVLLLILPTALGATACTAGRDAAPPAASSRPAPTSAPTRVATSPPPSARSAPWRVRVASVAGRLGARDRRALVLRVGRTLSAYVGAAFLTGDYPRSDFTGSFSTSFTRGAARRARADLALLTNRPLGPTTQAVRAVRRTARLSVLAPGRTPVGVTAAVSLVLLVDRGERVAQRLRLRGRLLLTPGPAGTWWIFGYDLARSQTPAGRTS